MATDANDDLFLSRVSAGTQAVAAPRGLVDAVAIATGFLAKAEAIQRSAASVRSGVVRSAS